MDKKTSFEVWSQEWLRRKEPFIKYSTFAAYTNIVINHLIPYWGATALTDISEEQVQEYVLHLVSTVLVALEEIERYTAWRQQNRIARFGEGAALLERLAHRERISHRFALLVEEVV